MSFDYLCIQNKHRSNMNIKQVKTIFASKENTSCPLTEKLVTSGYQQLSGGYIKRARKENQEINFKKNLPSQFGI